MTANRDAGVPVDVDRLLAAMTLEEKAAIVSGADLWHTVAIERLGVPSVMCADGPHGLRAQVGDGDHVGLEGSVPATCFPTASALASTWDADLVREVGTALAREARRWGVSVILGPGVNMKRSPLCGRNFEYLSEDPFLAGELGAAMVEGIQSLGVGASVKHFAANNQEDDRLRVSADVDERTLREIYLPAFERIVTGADPWTVMCAYNKVNGVHASEHTWLLTEVLRNEWGWDGVVVSDWGACHDRVAALRAGLDWEMPPDLPGSPAAVTGAIRAGALDEAVLDRSVRRMLTMVAKAAGVAGGDGDREVDEAGHHALARRAAAEAIVLLKNDGDLLPIGAGTTAVIGALARRPRFQGAGSSRVNPTRVDVPLDELVEALGADRVTFAAGYDPRGAGADGRLVAEAVAVARGADTVVCFLGLPASHESEGFDRTHIELPANQVALLEAVAAVHRKVVVVLVNGSVVRVSGWADQVPAVVECWLGGQAAGGAVADVLTGRVNPSGRLAETIPVRLEDTPSYLSFPGDSGHVRYGEGVYVGYRGHDRLAQPVSFPFGHGLSYTTFRLDDLEVRQAGAVAAGDLAVVVTVAVTNTGTRAGAHVVQVYVSDHESSVARPVRELKGFAKVRLQPGEREDVTIALDQRAFSFWSERLRCWVVEAGRFDVAVGSSSRDLPLVHTLVVDAPSIAAPLDEWSTLQEWLDDPVGTALLDEVIADNPWLANRWAVQLFATMPLRTLAANPAFTLDHQRLAGMVQELRRRSAPGGQGTRGGRGAEQVRRRSV